MNFVRKENMRIQEQDNDCSNATGRVGSTNQQVKLKHYGSFLTDNELTHWFSVLQTNWMIFLK